MMRVVGDHRCQHFGGVQRIPDTLRGCRMLEVGGISRKQPARPGLTTVKSLKPRRPAHVGHLARLRQASPQLPDRAHAIEGKSLEIPDTPAQLDWPVHGHDMVAVVRRKMRTNPRWLEEEILRVARV